ncbi:MAG TPA: prepilin-type N-terminal cleavage/methylation domain-containing protein [Kofleriaceae bacterium]|nr:prepilin-type N-terminal cleavage/methylation domain-containing protein [Kofleriaceae bacterium]
MARTREKQTITAAARAAASASDAEGQRGFTMIEVLVTLAVTLIGLAGLMALHHVVSEGNSSAGRTTEASAIAETALEEVRQLAFAQIETQFGTAPIDAELEDATGKGDHVYRRRLLIEPIDAVSPDLFRVRIEVSWTEDGAAAGSDEGAHDHTFVLETLRTRQEVM